MKQYIRISHLRKVLQLLHAEEISFSRAVEMLNEQVEKSIIVDAISTAVINKVATQKESISEQSNNQPLTQ